jgi:Putative MetA-pathway of phenol degradation
MRCRRGAIGILIALVCAMHQARAETDDHPGDYVPLPPGTSALLSYNVYGIDDGANIGGVNFSGANTGLRSFTEVARYVHYWKVLGHTVDFNLLVPFGGYWDGQIGGVKLNNTFGASDPFLASSIWVIEQPNGRYFAVTPLLYFPVGSYTAGETLNTGEHRWKGTLEFGWVEPLIPTHLTLELNGNATWYGTNDRAGFGNQTLTQQPSFQFQPWLRYNFTPWRAVSAGYFGQFGGAQSLEGVSNGLRTEEHAIRLNFQQFLTNTLQLSATVAHDVAVVGGFKQVFVLDLRLGLGF